MRLSQIDGDLVERFLEVEHVHELVCRTEEYLPWNAVGSMRLRLFQSALCLSSARPCCQRRGNTVRVQVIKTHFLPLRDL
jgi:hypothetical protein